MKIVLLISAPYKFYYYYYYYKKTNTPNSNLTRIEDSHENQLFLSKYCNLMDFLTFPTPVISVCDHHLGVIITSDLDFRLIDVEFAMETVPNAPK